MMTLRNYLTVCALFSLVALGCSTESPTQSPDGSVTSDSAAKKSASATAAAKESAVSLAPAGDETPPLDGGRVQSVMPQGWKFLPRSSDYLFAAYFQEKGGVPRLVLRVTDAGDLPETSSAETAKPLAESIRKEFPSGKAGALSVLNVGENWFVRFEKKMSFRSLPASGVYLVTVQDGKRFTLELLTYADKKEEFLPALYRFAADLKVAAGQSPSAESGEQEEKAPGEAADKPEVDSASSE